MPPTGRTARAPGRSRRSSTRRPSGEQAERTAAVRAARDPAAAAAALEALGIAARGTENLLPRIRACVEADVTLGEIADALRATWGEHRP